MRRDVARHGDVGPEATRRYLKKHCPAGGSKEVFCVFQLVTYSGTTTLGTAPLGRRFPGVDRYLLGQPLTRGGPRVGHAFAMRCDEARIVIREQWQTRRAQLHHRNCRV